MFYSLWLVKTTGKLWHRQFGEIYFDFFFQFMISVHRKAHVSFWHLRNDFQTRKRCKSHTRFKTIARESEDLSLIKKRSIAYTWKQLQINTMKNNSYVHRASLSLHILYNFLLSKGIFKPIFHLKIAIIHCCNSFKSN